MKVGIGIQGYKNKKNMISIISFSMVLVQEDAVQGGNKGMSYYDTQKEAVVSYLNLKFSDISVDVIGANNNLLFKLQHYEKSKLIRLPNVIIPKFSSALFNLTSFLYMFLTPRPLIVLIYSGGESLPYLGALLYAKLYRIPFFMCIRNPPASLCSSKSLSFSIKTIKKILDQICLKCSTKIIHISEKSKELLKPYPRLYQKSIIMQSCPNNIFLEYDQRKNLENNKLTFAYWGVIDRMRELGAVITGFAKAKELDDKFDAKFYLVGGGVDLERLKELVKKLKLTDIIFKGYVRQEELCNFLQEISVAVISIPPEEFFQYSSPLKLAEAVTMELPIIASNIEPNQIVKEHNLGILCEHDVNSYAQAFLKFWSFSDSELNEFRENCKKIKYLFTPENVFKEVGEAIAPYLGD